MCALLPGDCYWDKVSNDGHPRLVVAGPVDNDRCLLIANFTTFHEDLEEALFILEPLDHPWLSRRSALIFGFAHERPSSWFQECLRRNWIEPCHRLSPDEIAGARNAAIRSKFLFKKFKLRYGLTPSILPNQRPETLERGEVSLDGSRSPLSPIPRSAPKSADDQSIS